MIRLSSGLRSSIVTNYGLGLLMQYGRIHVYTGSQPLSADFAPTGTLLATVSQDGITPISDQLPGGLELSGGAQAGQLVKVGTWVIRGSVAGTPGWWRFVWNSEDDASDSTFLPRIDGMVGESLVLGFPMISAFTSAEVAAFSLVLPPQ